MSKKTNKILEYRPGRVRCEIDEAKYRESLRSLEIHLVDWQYIRLVDDEGFLTGDVRIVGTVESAPAPHASGQRIVSAQILESGQGWCATYRQKYLLIGPVLREKLMTLDQLRDLSGERY